MTKGPPSQVAKTDNSIEFRRSPRLKSAPADAINGNVGSSGGSGKRKGKASVIRLSEENRRRSPRFSVASEESDSASRSDKKQVKGNEFKRSYYKCTYSNCHAKKYLLLTNDGNIEDCICIGEHNHSHPQPNNIPPVDPVLPVPEQEPQQSSLPNVEAQDNASVEYESMPKQIRPIRSFPPSQVSGTDELNVTEAKRAKTNNNNIDATIADLSSSESCHIKPKSKIEAVYDGYRWRKYGQKMVKGSPYQRKSDNNNIDATIADVPSSESCHIKPKSKIEAVYDGYRWRKYGQKMVKGSPYPRSYYRCSSPGCPAKKHVEKSSQGGGQIIASYEGQHDHQPPVGRGVPPNTVFNDMVPFRAVVLPNDALEGNLNEEEQENEESGTKGDSSSCSDKLQKSRFSNGTVSMQKNKNTKVLYTSTELFNSPGGHHSPDVDDINGSKLSLEAITSPTRVENGRTNSDYLSFSVSEGIPPKKKFKPSASLRNTSVGEKNIASFVGDPIPDDEARERWGWRYDLKDKECKDEVFKINEDEEDETVINVKCHYAQANVGNCIFSLGDCAFIKGEGEEKYIGRIVEFFKTTDRKKYFRVQWFYRIQDTVVKDDGGFHDKRRLFYSSLMNDNLIDSIIEKANVTYIKPKVGLKLTSILPSDFYYDMEYCVEYSTFRKIPTDNVVKINGLSQPAALDCLSTEASTITKSLLSPELHKTELALLDLYSGCGGMSTGLCLGAKLSSVNLITRWAVDTDRSASKSLKLNHPDTHVRNESAEDFLQLLKEWEKLCKQYKDDTERKPPLQSRNSEEKKQVNSQAHDSSDDSDDEFEVSSIVDICYGDPNKTGKHSLYLKVHWKGYDESEDTWEPIENLRDCKQSIQEFVRGGLQLLPLPGEVDVVCGGPPCQGISGYNRHRNTESPLDDERNRQIIVFMDIVKYLKPKYVLMENVVDILRFDKGSLGRYALSHLVHMNYQARFGIVAAGCYGLPQFRLRVFMWGAHPNEVLPQFPLPTHDVILRYWPPPEYEQNTVAYNEDQQRELEKAIVIQDAISDLPPVTNFETQDEISYPNSPETEFQRYIRSTKYEMTGSTLNGTTEEKPLLYDHRPLFMPEDDYLRICQIPKRKGANFRDLPGVVVGDDNKVRPSPTEKIPLLPSGKPLVPDYCFNFRQGTSKRPFGRLWWDETVPTAITFPSCRNQIVLHPEQDRILTVREYARLQGFPDYYRFCGSVKDRYRQIGNAVAVPVSRALGYSLGIAYRKLGNNEHHLILPPKFSLSNYVQFSSNHVEDTDLA